MPLPASVPDQAPSAPSGSAVAVDDRLSPAVSLYLDAWRLSAALAVMLCHFGSRRMSGGLLWQVTPYGAEAVDVFFVLSGFVIAHVAATRERDWRDFAASRAARLWSVAVPALCLTLLLDRIGRGLSPLSYAALPGAPDHVNGWLQAGAGLLFFGQAWQWAIPVGSNVPWWSLGYEVPFYLTFGLMRFGRGAVRRIGPWAVAVAVGPSIVAVAPLWFAGAAVQRRGLSHAGRPWAPWLTAALPGAGWLLYESICHRVGRPIGVIGGLRAETVQDLIVGGLFAVHLAGVLALLRGSRRPPGWLASGIRFGAARSFSLYLLHYPVMLFLRACMLHWSPGLSPFWLLPATLGVCLALAEVTERQKGTWRRWLGVRREAG